MNRGPDRRSMFDADESCRTYVPRQKIRCTPEAAEGTEEAGNKNCPRKSIETLKKRVNVC